MLAEEKITTPFTVVVETKNEAVGLLLPTIASSFSFGWLTVEISHSLFPLPEALSQIDFQHAF